jgi:hypothetical protein
MDQEFFKLYTTRVQTLSSPTIIISHTSTSTSTSHRAPPLQASNVQSPFSRKQPDRTAPHSHLRPSLGFTSTRPFRHIHTAVTLSSYTRAQAIFTMIKPTKSTLSDHHPDHPTLTDLAPRQGALQRLHLLRSQTLETFPVWCVTGTMTGEDERASVF